MEENKDYPPHLLELESKISRFFRTMKERHNLDASSTELSMPQFFCLWILSKCGKLKMSELAANLSLSYASATNLINRLSDANMVNRYDDPTDRRVVFVELSEKGVDLTECVRSKHMKDMIEKCKTLKPEQIDVMLKGMEILIEVVTYNHEKHK